MLPAGWFLPLFTARVPFLWREEISVVTGLLQLWSIDLVLFAIVLLFAVLMPAVKAIATLWVWYRVPLRDAPVWLERLGVLAKLSMTEIFLLAVVIVGFKGVGIGTVDISWGLYGFAGIAVFSLLMSIAATMAIRQAKA